MTGATIIVGAGPAGLGAALELTEHGHTPIVLEQHRTVGGLARTETYRGHRFDIGGHRFYTKLPEVEARWRALLGPDFRRVRRRSRIHWNGAFLAYPLSLPDAARHLGFAEGARAVASYCRARVSRPGDERTFEDWVVARFGRRLYEQFFRTYTEKVWGVPCNRIAADWAAQRIHGLSLGRAILQATGIGRGRVRSLIEEFDYPRLGPGMMWERCRDVVEARGGRVQTDTEVVGIRRDGFRVTGVVCRNAAGMCPLPARQLVSSMAITDLVARLDPPAPLSVQDAARGLRHRAFIVVALVLRGARLFDDQWLYVHTPEVRVGRIQNFKNWSPDLVTTADTTTLGLEYFCDEGDDLWSMADDALCALASRELAQLGLAARSDVTDAVVVRQPKAYPVYDPGYRERLDVLRRFLDRFENLQTIGRNGLHRYNNQDHAMLTGILAARRLLGGSHDVWAVSAERAHYEDFTLSATPA